MLIRINIKPILKAVTAQGDDYEDALTDRYPYIDPKEVSYDDPNYRSLWLLQNGKFVGNRGPNVTHDDMIRGITGEDDYDKSMYDFIRHTGATMVGIKGPSMHMYGSVPLTTPARSTLHNLSRGRTTTYSVKNAENPDIQDSGEGFRNFDAHLNHINEHPYQKFKPVGATLTDSFVSKKPIDTDALNRLYAANRKSQPVAAQRSYYKAIEDGMCHGEFPFSTILIIKGMIDLSPEFKNELTEFMKSCFDPDIDLEKSMAHPGFEAVAAKISSGNHVPMKNARAILASASRKASKKAKKKNPRLNRVKG